MATHRKSEEITTTELCKHGCGNVAKFKSPSGLLMCAKSANSCPENKKKNSSKCAAAYSEFRRPPQKELYKSLPQSIKDSMNWAKGKTAETHESIKRQRDSFRESINSGKYKPGVHGFAADPKLRWKRNYIPYIDSLGKLFNLESIHEWIVANELDKNSIKWSRPEKIKLKDGRGYEPDFYLIDYDIYLDPKSKWKGKPTDTYQGYSLQHEQLEKIKLCENEHKIKCLILWSADKRSHNWQGILEQINSY